MSIDFVTSAADDGSAGTLRNVVAGATAGDTILFAPSLAGATIALSSTLEISKNLTIDGFSGGQDVEISGGGAHTDLLIDPSVVATLNYLVIADGHGVGTTGTEFSGGGFPGGQGGDAAGGVFNNGGSLFLLNSILANNSATGGAGGAGAVGFVAQIAVPLPAGGGGGGGAGGNASGGLYASSGQVIIGLDSAADNHGTGGRGGSGGEGGTGFPGGHVATGGLGGLGGSGGVDNALGSSGFSGLSGVPGGAPGGAGGSSGNQGQSGAGGSGLNPGGGGGGGGGGVGYTDLGQPVGASLYASAIQYGLTTGVDSGVGAGNDIFVAQSGALSAGDMIDGGPGSNTLYLLGGGAFSLKAPKSLTDIQFVQANEGAGTNAQTITLRNGFNVVLDAISSTDTGAGITIKGAADSSIISLGAGKDTVVVGSATETILGGGGLDTFKVTELTIGATIDGGLGDSTLKLTSTGSATMGANITDVDKVVLQKAADFTANTISGLAITGSAGADTIHAGGADQVLSGGGGTDTLVGSAAGSDTFRDTAANFNGDTVQNFAAGGDGIDVTNIKSKGVSVDFSAGVLTVTNGASHTEIALTGTFDASGFHTSADGAKGTLVTYASPPSSGPAEGGSNFETPDSHVQTANAWSIAHFAFDGLGVDSTLTSVLGSGASNSPFLGADVESGLAGHVPQFTGAYPIDHLVGGSENQALGEISGGLAHFGSDAFVL